jgi:hypothetical protein
VEILHLQMQQATIGTPINQTVPYNAPHTQTPQLNPTFNNPAHRQIRYVTGNQTGTTQYPRGQPPTQEERDTMRTQVNELIHHPDTPTGQARYKEQLQQWRAKWRNRARCSEHTPFPLTPGTVQICLGECFRCGSHGHISPECQVPQDMQLMKNETIWQGICLRILRTYNRTSAPQVNIIFDNAYALETEDQGKGEGSSV